jgi:hypothetical protein
MPSSPIFHPSSIADRFSAHGSSHGWLAQNGHSRRWSRRRRWLAGHDPCRRCSRRWGQVGALIQASVSKEGADIYAEGLRRGGAVVSARVSDADALRLQDIIDRSAVNVRERATAYRQAGWQSFNAKETPYRADQFAKSVSCM